MKPISLFLAATTLIVAAAFLSPATAQESMNAKDLASRMNAAVNDGSSFIRLRMEIRGGARSTLQLQLKSRRTGAGSDILYQVLYPKTRKGESVLLQKHGGKPTGKVFVPGTGVQNIGSMKDLMFGSDLSYEDVIENFFAWPEQAVVGAEEVNNTQCQILESKGGGGSYSRVRSWIDTKRMVPLRVEKYAGNNVVRRIDTTRVAKNDKDRPVPASLVVHRGAAGETEIEGSDIRQDVGYTDKDFSPEGMQSLTPPSSK